MTGKWILILLLSSTINLFATDISEGIKKESNNTIKTTLTFLAGFPFPTQSSGFSQVYQSKVGGKNDYYKPSTLLTFKLLAEVFQHLDFGFSAENYSVSFDDAFSQHFTINGKITSREIAENIEGNFTPLLLLIQYTALRTNYTSYAGFGCGLSFDGISWNETVSSTIPNDTRVSGEIYKKRIVAPTIKIYSGTMLDFDKKDDREFLGAFHFEVACIYAFRYLSIFSYYNNINKKSTSVFIKKYNFLPLYFSLSAGISFNLYPEFGNKNKK